MKANKQIDLIKEFVEKEYLTKLTDNIRKDKKFLIIDFTELSKFNPELADRLLDQPKDTLTAFELAIGKLDIENLDDPSDIQIQFIKLPKDQEVYINKLRSRHIGKLIFTKGVVMTRTKVYPEIIATVFACPSCEKEITLLQLDTNLKEPSQCACGRKGKFRLVSKELLDTITIKLEELPERLTGSEQPNNVRVVLQGELCKQDYNIHLGARVEVVGYVEDIPLKAGQIKTTSCDFLFHSLNYTNLETVSLEEDISKEEQALFDEISSKSNPARFISKLIFGSIHGYTAEKEALIYQQFGGTTWKGRRDFINILLSG